MCVCVWDQYKCRVEICGNFDSWFIKSAYNHAHTNCFLFYVCMTHLSTYLSAINTHQTHRPTVSLTLYWREQQWFSTRDANALWLATIQSNSSRWVQQAVWCYSSGLDTDNIKHMSHQPHDNNIRQTSDSARTTAGNINAQIYKRNMIINGNYNNNNSGDYNFHISHQWMFFVGSTRNVHHLSSHFQQHCFDLCLRAGFTNTGQIASLLNSSYF